jgi:G8 domain
MQNRQVCIFQQPLRPIQILLALIAVAIFTSPVRAQQLANGIPNLCTNPTAMSVRTGSWSDPGTWSIGQVPTVNDRVAIAPGTTVTYDRQSDAEIVCINVSGQLTFRNDISTRLTVGTLTVLPGGGLQIGTASAPVGAGVTAEIVFADRPLDTGMDPEQYGTGLLGFGRVTMHGAVKSPTFVRLAAEVSAGQASLSLASTPSGWRPGDTLVLPGTNQSLTTPDGYQGQWETPSLAGLSGSQAALGSGLAFSHLGGRTAGGALTFLPHVGNISRNIIIRSQNPNGTRGHVLMTDRAEVDIRYVAFKDLGRTTISPLDSTTLDAARHATHIGSNQIGRYSLHMHHLFGPASPPPGSYQYVLIGNAIDGGTKWGITIHDTHYGLVQDNVVYNTGGAGITTEDGSETANVIDHNFIVRAWGTGRERADERQGINDWAWEGSGLWFHGPDNFVRNNVVANSNAYGAAYVMLGVDAVRVPKTPGDDPRVAGHLIDMTAVPLREFSANEFYGVHRGLTVWNLGAVCCMEMHDVPVSTFFNTQLWNVGVLGFYGRGENRVTFDGWVHYNDPASLANSRENSTSFYFGDYDARNIVIRRADIQGLRIGVQAPIKAGDTRDLYGATPGTLTIENSTLKNYWNIYTTTPYGMTGGGAAIPARLVVARNVLFSNVPGTSTIAGQAHVFRRFTPDAGANQNLIVSDRVVVQAFNGNSADNFEVFAPEQAGAFVIPASSLTTQVAGLTNQQAWTLKGIAIAGAITPCTITRPDIIGFVCPAAALPVPRPAPASTAPSIPTPPAPSAGSGTTTGASLPGATVPATANPVPMGIGGSGNAMPQAMRGGGSMTPSAMTAGPQSSPSRSTGCTTADPFMAIGGGTCSNGYWYAPTTTPANSGAPDPPPFPTSGRSSGCGTADPYQAVGGGICSNGTWYRAGGAAAPASTSSASSSIRASNPTPGACPGTDPFAGLIDLVGVCLDGTWIPVSATSTPSAPSLRPASSNDLDGDGVDDARDLCPGTIAGMPVDARGCPIVSSSAPPPMSGKTIVLNPAIKYQTITGWEGAVTASIQDLEPLTDAQLASLLNLAVNDLGITRARLVLRSGVENPNGNTAYEIVNDNSDPNVINPNGFKFTALDYQIDRFIMPLRQRTHARGESFYVNLTYVDFGDSAFEHYSNPQEYAEFMVATFQHMRDKYGFVPNAIEAMLEPNDMHGWSPTIIGQCIVATAQRLRTAGFSVPDFIGPSTSNMSAAAAYIDGIMAVPGAASLVKELSYHRYGGSLTDLQAITSRAVQYGQRTSMLEFWSNASNYRVLHQDLTVGRNSTWQQGQFADSNGCRYNQIVGLVNGTATVCPNTKLIRQYTKFVRPGAQRIDASSVSGAVEPLAFVNVDGRYVVVVKSENGGSFSISGLPAGTYGIFYTTSAQYDVNLSTVTISAGQLLSSNIPATGVITIYRK